MLQRIDSHRNTPAAVQTERQLVSFFLDGEEYALDILKVQEIIRFQTLTRVPHAPAFVEGVMNLRGRVVPVISLRRRFRMPPAENGKQSRIVVVDAGGVIVGLIVDAVSEVLRIAADAVEPPPQLVKIDRETISGVGKLNDRLLLLLDADRLLAGEESRQCQEAARTAA